MFDHQFLFFSLFTFFAVVSVFALVAGLQQVINSGNKSPVGFFVANIVIFSLCSYVSMRCLNSFLFLVGAISE